MILHSDANNALEGMEGTVTLCHRNTPPEQLCAFTKSADIVISATGNSEILLFIELSHYKHHTT